MIEITISSGKYFILALPLNHSPVTPHTKSVFFWFIFALFFLFLPFSIFFSFPFSVTRSDRPTERKDFNACVCHDSRTATDSVRLIFCCSSIHTSTNLSPEVNTNKRFCRNRFRAAAPVVMCLWWVYELVR